MSPGSCRAVRCPWSWNYRQLWAGLGTGYSGKAAGTLNIWATSPAPLFLLSFLFFSLLFLPSYPFLPSLLPSFPNLSPLLLSFPNLWSVGWRHTSQHLAPRTSNVFYMHCHNTVLILILLLSCYFLFLSNFVKDFVVWYVIYKWPNQVCIGQQIITKQAYFKENIVNTPVPHSLF